VQAVINSSAVTGGTVNIVVLAATATAVQVSASMSTQLQPVKLQVLVSAGPVAASIAAYADIPAATTIAIFGVGSTAYQIQQVAIMGYLF